jgi:hypothetical protein
MGIPRTSSRTSFFPFAPVYRADMNKKRVEYVVHSPVFLLERAGILASFFISSTRSEVASTVRMPSVNSKAKNQTRTQRGARLQRLVRTGIFL